MIIEILGVLGFGLAVVAFAYGIYWLAALGVGIFFFVSGLREDE